MAVIDALLVLPNGADVARPRSASAMWTGIAGIVAAGLAIVALRDWAEPTWFKTLVVAAVTGAAMVAVDLGVYRTARNPTTGLTDVPLRAFDAVRCCQKLVGFWLTIGALAVIYATLVEYAAPFYASFKSAAFWCLPGLAVVSPFYVAYVDRRQREPVDAYAQLGQLLWGIWPSVWAPLVLHARTWAVKGFFFPLMFAFAHDGLVRIWARDGIPSPLSFEAFFGFAIDLLYLFDVLPAVVSYALTVRLLDSHVRSVEPTVGGWVICLICYPPFVRATLGAYFNYNADQLFWGAVFETRPVVYVAWGTGILLLVGIYVAATLAFGLRFSNLTNRGIITSGPYRWVKHPAYLAKNLSWWMISVPFVAGAGWAIAAQSCLMLLCINLVYFLRAKTEERHLRSDPDYRTYEAFIAEHGLWARLARSCRLRRDAAA